MAFVYLDISLEVKSNVLEMSSMGLTNNSQ